VPMEVVQAIRSVRIWDETVITSRFGFADAADYYRRVSAGPLLPDLAIPTLVVPSESDPMIPAHSLRPALSRASSAVEVRWQTRGGHVGFPSESILMSQILAWLNDR